MRAGDVFRIGLDEHVTTAGATGTGKSHGTMLLMRAQRKPFVIYDSKASDTVAKFADRIITNIDDLDTIGKGENKVEKVAFRPKWDASSDEIRALCNGIARWAYLRKNIGLYVDEISDISRGPVDVPEYVGGISRRGRERDVTLWATTQRPAGVPRILMTEASHFYVYQLRSRADRDRMSQDAEHDMSREIQALDKREFLYVNAANGTVSGPFKFK